MNRVPIPEEMAAKILFLSDRICCICHTPSKPTQIHHINLNPKDNRITNLCVLCLDCHNNTQIKGGFHRKLNPPLVRLYRNEWIKLVKKRKTVLEIPKSQLDYKKIINAEAKVALDKKKYVHLAIIYASLNNEKLKNKYINLALKNRPDNLTLIFLRKLQGRINLVPKRIKNKVINHQKKVKDWSQLARTYRDFEEYDKSILAYCKSIVKDLSKENNFSAAFYLKELSKAGLYNYLFEKDYLERAKNQELWWQIRNLQELGEYDQVEKILIKNKEKIENGDDSILKQMLYTCQGDLKKVVKLAKENINLFD